MNKNTRKCGARMTLERRLERNAATIDSSLQMAKDRLLRAVREGSTGVVIIKVNLLAGGVRSLTVGDEMVVEPAGGKQKKPDP